MVKKKSHSAGVKETLDITDELGPELGLSYLQLIGIFY